MGAFTWAVAAVVTDDAGRVLLCRQGRGERRHALPGGRLRPAESPVHAAARHIRAETGWEVEVVDLVGIYHLTGTCGPPPAGHAGPLPDVLVHVFRARARGTGPAGDPMGGCRLSWHHPGALPEALTPTTRAALTDALADRSGVLRHATPTSPAPLPPTPDEPAPGDPATVPPATGGPATGLSTTGDPAPTTNHPPGQRTTPPTTHMTHP
ncbi:NUDIX domain-containing protein [Micromonospora sp. NPDC047074]|uniref:NUDIX hydrolase n=1 Tax=Micromonospora sp. NPDC047074 TaxID=3154339 RepID=UPI0033D9A09C